MRSRDGIITILTHAPLECLDDLAQEHLSSVHVDRGGTLMARRVQPLEESVPLSKPFALPPFVHSSTLLSSWNPPPGGRRIHNDYLEKLLFRNQTQPCMPEVQLSLDVLHHRSFKTLGTSVASSC